ncbi:putative colanic acid biosynthesis acetyltransferase [Bradyrhizobium vignae]|nr:putative colanic acid biosynthesis acetyltransferase [Bradyrhizobium vignae]
MEDVINRRASFPLRNRVLRFLWGAVRIVLFAPSPRPFHAWRAFLLRCFGASLGRDCRIYPKAQVWAPWNLKCDDFVGVADGAIIYNPAPISLATYAIVSQEAYLCGATHDYMKPHFPLVSSQITIGRYAWICARATVQPGVRVGDGAVLGLGAVATKDLDPWKVYAGIPARFVKDRTPIPQMQETGATAP